MSSVAKKQGQEKEEEEKKRQGVRKNGEKKKRDSGRDVETFASNEQYARYSHDCVIIFTIDISTRISGGKILLLRLCVLFYFRARTR